MPVVEFRPQKRAVAAAIGAVAATYAYFLLFAQFGFLQALQVATGGEQGVIKPVLTVMGIAGIGGSAFAAGLASKASPRVMLVASLMVCALAAALNALGFWERRFYTVALLIGLGTGVATVTLASGLRAAVGTTRLGWVVGAGTGVAYAFCNLPPIFTAAPSLKAWWSVAIAGAGVLATLALKFERGPEAPEQFDTGRNGITLWTLVFFALVGLDSGAFYVIQHTPSFKDAMWSGDGRLEFIAVVHLGAAMVAGLGFDRRWLGRTVGLAAALLVVACEMIGYSNGSPEWRAPIYAAAVSIYSAALVFYAAYSGRPWTVAVVYAIAGWCGSAAGIGLVESQHTLPGGLIGTAGILVAFALALRSAKMRNTSAPKMGLALLAVVALTGSTPKAKAEDTSLIARGRAVFISEGCMHCHSQYVRPETSDDERWGPVSSVGEVVQQMPPLVGNRRQGPDLKNVGNRRSLEWNQRHLIGPQSLVAGSRMPSYRYLFKSGSDRGTALLAYLDSLGAETTFDRLEANAHWEPRAEATIASLEEQKRLFGQWCAACHGADGHGRRTGSTPIRSADLTAGSWQHVPGGKNPAAERLALARLIKMGVPGTLMAGHEYLTDDAILSLAAYLQTVRAEK